MFREGGLAEERGVDRGSVFGGEHGGGTSAGVGAAGWAGGTGAAKVTVVEGVAVGRVRGGACRAGFAVGEGEQDFVPWDDGGDGRTGGEDYASTCLRRKNA